MMSRGQVLLLVLIFFAIFLSLTSALLVYAAQYSRSGRYALAQRQALYIAEAGVDNAIDKLNQDSSYAGESNTALGAGTFTSAVSGNSTARTISVTACVPNCGSPRARRTVHATLAINTSIVSFHYGVQIGNGGLSMNNGSKVVGNVYSNGSISGSGEVTGDATVGSTGSISGITVDGKAWAHSLSNCTIGGDASYTTISSCSVGGTKYAGSADAATSSFPISAQKISDWETTATNGGTIQGDYSVSGTQLLGPKKINGNLTVSGTLYLTGPIWVSGNITFSNNSNLIVHPSTGTSGAVIIADVPGSESTQGLIYLSNNMTISGNGNTGTYPMLLSTNSSTNAISLNNNATGVILYAPNGTVQVSNNGSANEITAYRLQLNNNTSVYYVSGLQSQSFSNGPGGSWALVSGSYSITN